MEQIDQNEKTLVFCATQAHALSEQHLRDFQDNEKSIPTILTASQKLATGVDARNTSNGLKAAAAASMARGRFRNLVVIRHVDQQPPGSGGLGIARYQVVLDSFPKI